MSVYELPNYSDQGGPDRLPPQDIAAEASVLGSMLLSKDAIGEVTPILKVEDFYRPNHQATS
jgi:replicative DNA helicase